MLLGDTIYYEIGNFKPTQYYMILHLDPFLSLIGFMFFTCAYFIGICMYSIPSVTTEQLSLVAI